MLEGLHRGCQPLGGWRPDLENLKGNGFEAAKLQGVDLSGAAWIVLAVVSSCTQVAFAQEKPNIVMLFIDEWAWNATPVATDGSPSSTESCTARCGLLQEGRRSSPKVEFRLRPQRLPANQRVREADCMGAFQGPSSPG